MSKPIPFTTYRVIRIDGFLDEEKHAEEDIVTAAVEKVISDAKAHMHTIENGVEITDITDCGESC